MTDPRQSEFFLGAPVATDPISGEPKNKSEPIADVIPIGRARFVPVSQMVLENGRITGWIVCNCDSGEPDWPGHSDSCPIKEA